MISPQNPRQVCWSSPPSTQFLKDSITITCEYIWNPGNIHLAHVTAPEKENATVIKHVMERDALSSLLPVEVTCKRFCQIMSLILPSCKCQYWCSAHENSVWVSVSLSAVAQPWFQAMTQFLQKRSYWFHYLSFFTEGYLLLQVCRYQTPHTRKAPQISSPRDRITENMPKDPYYQQLQLKPKTIVTQRESQRQS